MIYYILTFLGGSIVGVILMAFMIGATQNERLKEAFNEGFHAGKQYN